MQITESDSSGRTIATYLITATPSSSTAALTTSTSAQKSQASTVSTESFNGSGSRVDIIRPQSNEPLPLRLWKGLLDVFLPVGFPGSVAGDYLEYQIYDSLQAFCSSIAGLLSSRAVLEGVGVGDSTASPTSALLLHILQDSTGRLATILFAHRLGSALEPECKRYRLLADILNDVSMVLDCLSPAAPRGVLRVSLLSFAGVLRALCGVSAGAAKASLSVHFARQGNVGELNAKDASQEIVISLLGMLVGSFVVQRVVGLWETWTWLVALLACHLGMNAAAVRAVRMQTLNRQRAGIVFGSLLWGGEGSEKGAVLSAEEVRRRERIFEWDGVVRGVDGRVLGWTRIGVSFEEVAGSIGKRMKGSGALKADDVSLDSLVEAFSDEEYLLWYDVRQDTVLIALRDEVKPVSQLKSWAHAMIVLQKLGRTERKQATNARAMDAVISSSKELAGRWQEDVKALQQKGWDLDIASLETTSGTRFDTVQPKS